MEIKFGKYKGKTVSEIAEDEQGRGYLAWLIAQPNNNPKFAEANMKRNKYISEVLEMYKGNVGGEGSQPTTPVAKGPQIQVASLESVDEKLSRLNIAMGRVLEILEEQFNV